MTSRALARICAVLARCPESVTRSRWRESRTTRRRAASSRSTVRTWSGSTWRTAAVHGGDAGRVGEGEQPGSVRPASGGSFRTTVQHHLDGETVTGQHRLPGREQVPGAVSATREGCPPDVGVGAEQHQQPTRPTCLPDVVSPGGQQITSGHRDPRSPRRWVCVTSRHRAAHPAPGATPATWPRASTLTRGRRGSTMAPPRTGVRGRWG